jgi:hypothetical protein
LLWCRAVFQETLVARAPQLAVLTDRANPVALGSPGFVGDLPFARTKGWVMPTAPVKKRWRSQDYAWSYHVPFKGEKHCSATVTPTGDFATEKCAGTSADNSSNGTVSACVDCPTDERAANTPNDKANRAVAFAAVEFPVRSAPFADAVPRIDRTGGKNESRCRQRDG